MRLQRLSGRLNVMAANTEPQLLTSSSLQAKFSYVHLPYNLWIDQLIENLYSNDSKMLSGGDI